MASHVRSGILPAVLFALLGCGEPDLRFDPARFPYVLDLAAHAEIAAVGTETRLVDLGTPESHELQVEGWTDDGVFADDGSTFAWSLGAGSTLQLMVLDPRHLRIQARLRPYRIDGPRQKVAVALNGRPVRVLTLKGGMRTYRFELPAHAVVRGPNELGLVNVYPEKIGPGPPDLGPPGTAWDYLCVDGCEPVAVPEARGGDLHLPFGSDLAFYLEAADAGLFVIDALESSHRRGRLEVRVRLAGESGPAAPRRLRASRRPAGLGVDVPGPTLVGLTLSAVGTPASGGLLLRRPRLLSAAAVTTERRGLGVPEPPAEDAASRRPASRRNNVLVYLVDTLRADHLGCYGYERDTSPRLDAFAADAVLFEDALAQSSWTRSSVASLFTGRQPPSHGVHGREDALSEEAVTLAEVLGDAGYATAAFVTNGNASRPFGFAQGFDVFELLGEDRTTAALHALSDDVHRAVSAWLDRLPAGHPFFVYAHTMEPHAPYAPPAEAVRRLGVRPSAPDVPPTAALAELRERLRHRFGAAAARLELGSMALLQGLRQGVLAADPEMTASLAALYDAEISSNDRHFGALLDELRRRGLYDETVVVFVSDHGEEIHDHGGWEHGTTLFQEQLRVPLIVRFPDAGLPRGVRLPGPARQIDVLPTLADYLALPLPEGVEGASLLPEISGRGGSPRPAYSHLDLDGRFAESLVEGRFKILCEDRRVIACRLFDLAADPGEQRDLAVERPVLAGYLEQRLRTLRKPEVALEAVAAEVDDALAEHLRALGYL
jgi:arylsulfatase A-like enzyme